MLMDISTQSTNSDEFAAEDISYPSRHMLAWHNKILKRAFDFTAAASLLALASPVMAVTALLIKMDGPGPVIFRQQRTGQNGEAFTILKFRTMVQHNTPASQLDYVKQGDPRITRFGRILRNTSLDELPQLFNVLRGEMSMVGPRPQPVFHLSHYSAVIPEYPLRLIAKPGITGLVQVSEMRSQVDDLSALRKRVAQDLEYIDRWSLLGDIKLCV